MGPKGRSYGAIKRGFAIIFSLCFDNLNMTEDAVGGFADLPICGFADLRIRLFAYLLIRLPGLRAKDGSINSAKDVSPLRVGTLRSLLRSCHQPDIHNQPRAHS